MDRHLVLVSGAVADKAARLVARGDPVEVRRGAPRFVGRGGEKLDAALTRFGIDVSGLSALDAGSSTGGFTDCLLQRGARRVVAVDVGRNQLNARLAADPRVESRERLDIREVTVEHLGGRPVDMVTADLSFISVTRAVPVLVGGLAAPRAPLVLLVKPQFEAGRAEASRGHGIIRDPGVQRRTLGEVAVSLTEAGAAIMGVMSSPLTGSAGNIEFFIHATVPAVVSGAGERTGAGKGTSTPPPGELEGWLDAAVAEAHRADLARSASPWR